MTSRLRTKASASYVKTHWGQEGSRTTRMLRAADPHAGPVTEMGQLVSVVYRTKKGRDAELTDYEHKFRAGTYLAYNRDGLLMVVGGTYTLNERGIIG